MPPDTLFFHLITAPWQKKTNGAKKLVFRSQILAKDEGFTLTSFIFLVFALFAFFLDKDR